MPTPRSAPATSARPTDASTGFRVSSAGLRRAHALLEDLPQRSVPWADVDVGWAATDAWRQVIETATAGVAGLADRTTGLAEALDEAARRYERCDADAAGRFDTRYV